MDDATSTSREILGFAVRVGGAAVGMHSSLAVSARRHRRTGEFERCLLIA